MIDQYGRFVIKDYGRKSTFSSFLPGISGMYGIPIWCYYVNRGQCITSFGVQDKEHSIMEFFPAHQAYYNTKRMGFRTFLKVNGCIIEPFSRETEEHEMYIGMNELEIFEKNNMAGIETSVKYFTLPSEEAGGLVRCLTIKNTSDKPQKIEIIDGMPAVVPYGVSLDSMKNMGQTCKAWMEVLDHKEGLPFFHVRASMEDSAQVTHISGGNFAYAISEKGEQLPVIVDVERLFSYDTSLENPLRFAQETIDELIEKEQITQNNVPCCFFTKDTVLEAGEETTLYEVFGQAESKELFRLLFEKGRTKEFFEGKHLEAVLRTTQITNKIATKTGSAVFDLYCRQTFLDNVLRGGYPIMLGDNKLFYLYSRKHGDVERDYNSFSMLPEYYSQGNGNFRDVNQNRRCDVMFSPFVEDKNIKSFYNCIQINGYNPLGIEMITYHIEQEKLEQCLEGIPEKQRVRLSSISQEPFTPGVLYQELQQIITDEKIVKTLFEEIIKNAEYEEKTKFGEGYWCDHWTYNLDLIESYLSIYPENEEALLYEDQTYTYRQAEENIRPRAKRYVKTEKGIRQYNFLEKRKDAAPYYLTDRNGTIIKSSLIEKLFMIISVKMAAIDAYGMGVEMEGGKPGWYDALNGLPGILGSSMSETYELARNIEFIMNVIEKYPKDLSLLEEISTLAVKVYDAIELYRPENVEGGQMISYWNQVNDAKEAYWVQTKENVSGKRKTLSCEQLKKMLLLFERVIKKGIKKAIALGKGICPTYFYYQVNTYLEDEYGIYPTGFQLCNVPYFLEGPVHYLKLDISLEEKQNLYEKIKKSNLYDSKLKMYKVNSSLSNASFELGRARAFTPGWLENESIWLHMEYKYLLELLKAHLYDAFAEDFYNAAVPFLDEEVYGRSILENSSFIASSMNPNPMYRGKGFVARLSGSTAEFLQMWQIMMFGERPFYIDNGTLCLTFSPLIPKYLIGGDKTVEAAFLGSLPIVYYLPDEEECIPGNYRIASYTVQKGNDEIEIEGGIVKGSICKEVRNGEVQKITIIIKRI